MGVYRNLSWGGGSSAFFEATKKTLKTIDFTGPGGGGELSPHSLLGAPNKPLVIGDIFIKKKGSCHDEKYKSTKTIYK